MVLTAWMVACEQGVLWTPGNGCTSCRSLSQQSYAPPPKGSCKLCFAAWARFLLPTFFATPYVTPAQMPATWVPWPCIEGIRVSKVELAASPQQQTGKELMS